MPMGLAGEPFTFHVLWLDATGEPATVASPAIDIFTFDVAGDKQMIVSDAVMVAVPGDTGRYAYIYSIPADFDEPSPLYGLMTATEVATGANLVQETEVDVIDPASGGSDLAVYNEGVVLDTRVTRMDFIGPGVAAMSPSSGLVNVYVPEPSYQSHWNTDDGDNGNQSVSENISRRSTRISTPSGGEGVPFKTGGWANTNQSTTLNTTATFTTPDETTGFGGDSTMTVTVYDADGATPLEAYTTGVIDGNAVHTSPSGNLVITITGYAIDTLRFKAKASVAVAVGDVLSDAGLQGGRCHVVAMHTTDSSTDGTGPYTYTQTAVFLDTNPSTPAINGAVSITETVGQVLTKHLSGVEYYILNSQFTAGVTNIDDLNANTIRTSANLVLSGSEYGFSTVSHCPFGTGSTNFSGWTSDNDQDDVAYQMTDWAITQSSYRYYGTSANISAYPRDPWASGGTVNSGNASLLIDTYAATSSGWFEGFDDENYRQDSGYNEGDPLGNWNSTAPLVAGVAMVHNGRLMAPSVASYQDWSGFEPNLGGANPNYTGFGVPVDYYRTFGGSGGIERSSMVVVFTGTFVANATTDLINGHLQVFVRRMESPTGDYGPDANPLFLHGAPYNFASFDDGVTNGQIREDSSSGNTVNATFGGIVCEAGVYVQVRINNAAIQIDSMTVSFF